MFGNVQYISHSKKQETIAVNPEIIYDVTQL